MAPPPQTSEQKVKAGKARRGFLYHIEYCINPDCIQIHTRTRFPEFEDHSLDLRFLIKLEKNKKEGKPVPPFYKELSRIHGLKSASDTDGYSLQCMKANGLFRWDEILPKILKAIQTHIAKKRLMVAAQEPKYPTPQELEESRQPSRFW